MDRRTFLRATALTAAVGGLGAGLDGLLAPPAEASTDRALPITGADHLLVKPHVLDYKAGFQSFAWSPAMKAFLYAEPKPHSGSGIARAKHYGDILISSITTSGHTTSGHMQLNGFGHGGVMGVEISPHKYSYIWIETNAHPNFDSKGNPTDADSRGICCIRYTGSGTYKTTDLGTSKMPHSEHYVLKPGSTTNQVTYDAFFRRIALRYHLNGQHWYAIYDVDAIRKNPKAAPVYDHIPATRVEAGAKGSYQSFALHGNWLYALHGSKGVNDATLHAYYLPSGHTASVAALGAAHGTLGREPEGLCVYTGGSSPRLAFGIKNDQHSSSNQTSAIYVKG